MLAFSCKDHGADASDDLVPTLRAMNHSGSHANAGGQMAVVVRTANTGANGHGFAAEVSHTLDRANGQAVARGAAVRRLTPRECERLQGFPDDYTLIPHRGKPAADGPRYKALGNSWAVPVVAWVGCRIQQVENL